MIRIQTAWTGSCARIIPTFAVGFLLLNGCGEQDLYRPPYSPYQVAARLRLESAPEDVAILGTIAYVAGGQAGLVIVDISDPSLPFLRGTIDSPKYAEAIDVASVPFGESVIDIAFVVEGTEGITTYNVTDPDSAYSFEQGTTAVDGNGLFIEIPEDRNEPYIIYLAENWKGMRIFESNPAVPGLLDYHGVFSDTRGYAKAIAVAHGYAYVADDEMGVAVLDVQSRVLGDVKVVSSCDTEGNSRGIAVAGGYAYVADGRNGLVVMSIHEGETPTRIGHLPLAGDSRAIALRDDIVFIAAQDAGLHVVDISSPTAPEQIGQVVSSYANGVGISKQGTVVVSDRDEGLIVLGGPGPFSDTTPPSQIVDVMATATGTKTIRLAWHSPGDDRYSGTASAYDIRYAATLVTDESWDQALPVDDIPVPARSGSAEGSCVVGLDPGIEYFFAIRAVDAAANWSGLSNVASTVTPQENAPPVLSGGTVSPEVADPGTSFVFEISYADGDNDSPVRAELILSGEAHEMSLFEGDYSCGALFRFETTLDLGIYDHYFEFDDGNGHVVATPQVQGPFSGEHFLMGSPTNEEGRDKDETLHPVVLSREVEFSPHEVTQAEFEAVMGTNPSRHEGTNRPVEHVTWFDAVSYCNALSLRDGLTPAYTIDGETVTWNRNAGGWRLPTEAEWEYACRAGSETAFATGTITEQTCGVDPVLDAVGWYCGNAGPSTHDVETKSPNAWGLYDMHGNVWEWCWDWYLADLGSGVAADPTGPAQGMRRVIRGGSWYYFARECRSASRGPYWPNSKDDLIGFRVVRTTG